MRYTIAPQLTKELAYDWEVVSGEFDDPFIDPRMIVAVQESMGHLCHFQNVIVYDEEDRPAAVACFFVERADALMMAPQPVRRLANVVRRVRGNFLRFPMLFCGLPASAGWNQLRVRPGADVRGALSAVHRAQESLRRDVRPRATVFMEFNDRQAEELAGLSELGYARADSPPMYVLPAEGRTFMEYLGTMKSHYRRVIAGSERRFAKSGVRVIHATGAAPFLDVFDDELYQLYVQVVRRAEVMMHVLPLEYFRAVARRFDQQFLSTFLYQGERPVGFAVGIVTPAAYYGLFIGLNYAAKLNAENQATDLYFNLFYQNLRYAMQRRVQSVFMGSDSDRFKLRLGCRRQRRNVFIHLHGLLDRPFRQTQHWWLRPHKPGEPEMDVFRAPADIASSKLRSIVDNL
ncbi:MAG TPA: GNAT family N-acetyltransferase [Pirellulales bacterium]|jgi:predicted N-acyltransferase